MRRRLVVGNWKMHGSLAQNRELLQALQQETLDFAAVSVAVCPPFVYLAQVAELLTGSAIAWGAQNVSEQASGAFTGEVAASMLADLDVCYTLVGHSERRQLFAETDQQIAAKFIALQEQGITPILCVGETLQQRQAGAALTTVAAQIQAVIDAAGMDAFARAVIAYEPVWAIGTGETATPEQAQQVHAAIRQQFAAQPELAQQLLLLYGGSVKPDNATELFSQPDIDGGLVGGAALNAADFAAICKAAV